MIAFQTKYKDVLASDPALKEKFDQVCQKHGRSFNFALSFPPMKQAYAEFIKGECSSETLSFYDIVNEFKKNPTLQKAKEIRQNYIEVPDDSPFIEINIPGATKKDLLEELDKGGVPSSGVFDKAQAKIYDLMLTDSFVRFKKSGSFKEFTS
ncbi:regulator of G-protein signaling domain-containing protein [Candidatus Protochlamydia phocaeensis]|uniref:regulator of G-protein signaling domain-containing protein n=1 Tax=Candidatus Protochlamydia phocaeensis TaxID=1414722 RepID=UPI0008382F33|nr:hypothetical protein [Candidatus Protochlamydia phocaeensis]